MTATPSQISFTEDDFKERKSYAELTPGDYTAQCTDVEDIVASTGNPGWKFTFSVEGLPVYTRVYHNGGGKWKIREVFNALGFPIDPGTPVGALDPNALVGNMCAVTIVKEEKQDTPGEFWTNISKHTPLVVASPSDVVSL